LIIFSSHFHGYSQFSQKQFIIYNKSNGLTDNWITALKQDRFGYLWIATQQGLNRFDGLNFKTIQSNRGEETLPSDEIVNLKWIDSNRLAVITKSGLNILDVQSMKQESVIIPPGFLKYHYKVNSLREFLSDANGNCYIASRSGFYHFSPGKKLVFRYDDYTAEEAETAMGFGTYMSWLDENNIIVAGQHGIHSYNIITRKFSTITKDDKGFEVFDVILRMGNRNFTHLQPWPGCFLLFINDSDTAIFINERRKLVKYSRLPLKPLKSEITWQSNLYVEADSTLFLSGKKAGLFQLKIIGATGAVMIDTVKSFADKRCNSFFIDRQSRLWIGSSNGLITENRSPGNLRIAGTPEDIVRTSPGASILQLAVTDKNIFAVNLSGSGMYVFKKADLSFKEAIRFRFPEEGNNSTYAIARRGKDTILCGANMQLFWYDVLTGKTGDVKMPFWDSRHNWVADMFTDRSGNTWITCNKPGTIYLYKKDAAQPGILQFDQPLVKEMGEIFHIAEDEHGNIWMAGEGAGRYNIRRKEFDIYLDSFPAIRWAKRNVGSIVSDQQGGIWMGNATNGLILYEPAGNKFTSFTRADGLPDNQVLALKIVKNNLWVACLNGIAKMDLRTRTLFQVANSKEMQSRSISSNNLGLDEDQQFLYAGLGTSIMQFDAAGAISKNRHPKFFVENILLGNDQLLWNPGKKINTSWKNNDVTISFNAINYDDAHDQYYAYRITNGENKNWVALDGQRTVVFNNLSAGKHLVEAKVFSPNNRWPAQFTKLSIFISPPYWNTWWFYLLLILVLSGIIYSVFRYRINELKKIFVIRSKISHDLHDEVGATLSGIAMYSHLSREQIKSGKIADVERSLSIIQKSAGDMIRKLSDIVWVVNPQHDSLEKLLQKLEEYGTVTAITKNIKMIINAEPGISELKLSMESRHNVYLIFKEAINNAIKYSGATVINLGVNSIDRSVEIYLKDNGRGFDEAGVKKGNGLENMYKRAEEIGATLKVHSIADEGTLVWLRSKTH
jgi:ligand-binding sensor domain-containing protein